MLRAILFILMVNLLHLPAIGQEASFFEGTLTLKKTTLIDTSFAIITIKGKKIRFDELDNNKKLKKYTIIDINIPELYVFNVQRKLYTLLPIHPWANKNKEEIKIIKSENYKEIYGYKCLQWRVQNLTKNIEVTYWVVPEGFPFFSKMMKLLNINENISNFFLKIPDAQNAFPMLAVERTLLREWKSEIKVINIDKHPVDNSIFKVPKDFAFFEK